MSKSKKASSPRMSVPRITTTCAGRFTPQASVAVQITTPRRPCLNKSSTKRLSSFWRPPWWNPTPFSIVYASSLFVVCCFLPSVTGRTCDFNVTVYASSCVFRLLWTNMRVGMCFSRFFSQMATQILSKISSYLVYYYFTSLSDFLMSFSCYFFESLLNSSVVQRNIAATLSSKSA